MKKKILVLFALFTTSIFYTQTVSTLVESFPGNDEVSIGDDRNIYVNQ